MFKIVVLFLLRTEASPTDYISHNLTITAYNYVSSLNITLFIYAPVNAAWQIIDSPYNIPWPFPLGANQSLPMAEIWFDLPQNANGKLKCTLYVQTNQTADYSSCTFYTTHVSEPTLSEMQQMLANYNSLQADYETLLNEYDGLLVNYSSLFANYTALLSEHGDLLDEYDAQVATYESLLNTYNTLSSDYSTLNSDYRSKLTQYNALLANYDSLNSTHYSLLANYTILEENYSALNQTYIELEADLNDLQQQSTRLENALNTDSIVMFIFVVVVACLVAFIIYIKRKGKEPYVVIRKETVSMKPEEKT